jgi:hypothetical protein
MLRSPSRLYAVAVALALATGAAARAYDGIAEAHNYAKQLERFTYGETSPGFQLTLAVDSVLGLADPAAVILRDPSRRPFNACAVHANACVGDPRLSGWAGSKGRSIPVSWVNRNGATISGHIWAPLSQRLGRARLPGIVITTGDTEAPEQIYWWAAQVLAAHGYEVLTFDPQGHGESDTIGAGDDTTTDVVLQQSSDYGDQAALDQEFATEIREAIDFLVSTPDDPFVPGRSAASKQRAQAAGGLVDGWNPLHAELDRSLLGAAGHSRGAYATSIIGSASAGSDLRVGAIVAWDNLNPGEDPAAPLVPRAPALGIASEYYVGDPPFLADPDPEAKNQVFSKYAAAGIDAMEVTIRGGTHFEYSFLPNPAFTATLRGIDLAAWYTLAWFDKELKGDPTADRRLLSSRWRDDAAGAVVDLDGDGNLFSWRFRSRIAYRRTKGPHDLVICDDVRAGCAALVDATQDGGPASYSFLEDRGP